MGSPFHCCVLFSCFGSFNRVCAEDQIVVGFVFNDYSDYQNRTGFEKRLRRTNSIQFGKELSKKMPLPTKTQQTIRIQQLKIRKRKCERPTASMRLRKIAGYNNSSNCCCCCVCECARCSTAVLRRVSIDAAGAHCAVRVWRGLTWPGPCLGELGRCDANHLPCKLPSFSLLLYAMRTHVT